MARSWAAFVATYALILFVRIGLLDGWRAAALWTGAAVGISVSVVAGLLAAGRRPDWNNVTRYNRQRIQGLTGTALFALFAAGAAREGNFGWAAVCVVAAVIGYRWARRATH